MMNGRFVVAIAGAPFGLDGRIKIQSLSGEEGHLFRLKTALLRKDGVEREYPVQAVFPRPLSFQFEGIDSVEAAKSLNGAEIIAQRNEAAPLNEGEFYIEDLKGVKVYAAWPEEGDAAAFCTETETSPRPGPSGSLVGEILAVTEGGGGFLAEIGLLSGERRLVPFRDEFFGEVDPEQGRAELLVRWILD